MSPAAPFEDILASEWKSGTLNFKKGSTNVISLLRRADKYAGVRPIHIYLLRLVYGLMFFLLGWTTWSGIFTHQGPWEPVHAVSWCVWTAFATLAGLGLLRPLKMLPILLLEVFYKVLWLILVAYPLWSTGKLAGSPAEDTTSVFIWVILPIVAIPWGYAFRSYVYGSGGFFSDGEARAAR